MNPNVNVRWALGTLAVVAVALGLDTARRSRAELAGARAAQVTVCRQLDAFNRDDYRAAYQFAAPEIQAQFSLPEFRQMVQRGYSQIAHSRSASFGRPVVHGESAVLRVTITGQDGVPAPFAYLMRREKGGWRVAGVMSEHAPPGAAPAREPTTPGKEQREEQRRPRDPRSHSDVQ